MQSPLETALFLVVAVERFQAGFITPLWEKFNWDKFYLMYVAWALGSALVFLSGVNLFIGYVPDPTIGRVITALVAGGGANLLHDFKDNKEKKVP